MEISKMSASEHFCFLLFFEAVVWLDAAAAFMPLSFMVNGSVVNLRLSVC